MAKKKILSVGAAFALDEIQYCSFNSDTSLLDWDIILFRPDISQFLSNSGLYQGKPSLSDNSSFKLIERSQHWRREILDSFKSGKTVIVFLAALEEVFVDTGDRKYSGTGKNQKTTRIVKAFHNYECLPAALQPIKTKGHAIKLVSGSPEFLAPYWKEFEQDSQYNVILNGEKVPACLVTKNGDRPVGAVYRKQNSPGALLFVPDIDFNRDEFTEERDGELYWTEEATNFAARMLNIVVSLDSSLKNENNITPEPEWAKASEYELPVEKEIRSELFRMEEKLEEVLSEKRQLLDHLEEAGRLRNLLYEKGKPLEWAIIDALKILGFHAAPYKDSESEFDVVFESDEGRFIGEAEGKDTKAVNIDKLRQLAMNIHEDLEREGVEEPAKAVLFGNPYRLEPVSERKDPFTAKCITAASRNSTALVFTPDLFKVAKHLSKKKDERLASDCRNAILNGVGLVVFPEIMESEDADLTSVTSVKA